MPHYNIIVRQRYNKAVSRATKLSDYNYACHGIVSMHQKLYLLIVFHDFGGSDPHPRAPKFGKNWKKTKTFMCKIGWKLYFFHFSWFLGGPTPHPPPNFFFKFKIQFSVKCIKSYIFFDFSWFLGGPTPHPPPIF